MKLLGRRTELLLRYVMPYAAAGTLVAGVLFILAALGLEASSIRATDGWFTNDFFGVALIIGGLYLKAVSLRVNRNHDRKNDPTRTIRPRLAAHLRQAARESAPDDSLELQGA